MLHLLAFWQLDNLPRALVAMLAFGLVGILLMVIGFKVFDWITPRIDVEKELAERHNIAVGIVIAAVILGVAAITVASML
jgi:putative membrane protein